MKKINVFMKILLILLTLTVIGIIISNYAYAGISLPSNLSNIYSSTDHTIGTIGGRILWVLQIIFYGAAVIILMFTGVKYMASAPDAKAEFKKKSLYMIAGAVMLFAAGGIVTILANLAMDNI